MALAPRGTTLRLVTGRSVRDSVETAVDFCTDVPLLNNNALKEQAHLCFTREEDPFYHLSVDLDGPTVDLDRLTQHRSPR